MAASCYGGVVCLCVAGRRWQPAVTVVWSVFVLLAGDGSQLLRLCGLSLCCWQGMAASCYGGVARLCVPGRRWQPAVTVVWSVFVLLAGDGSQLLRWCGPSLCCWQGMAASCYGGVVRLCVAGRGWQPAITVVWSVFVLLVGDGSQLLRWCGLSLCCW